MPKIFIFHLYVNTQILHIKHRFTIAAHVPVIEAPALEPANVGNTQTPPLQSVDIKYW